MKPTFTIVALLFVASVCFAEAKPFDEQSRATQNLFKRYARDWAAIEVKDKSMVDVKGKDKSTNEVKVKMYCFAVLRESIKRRTAAHNLPDAPLVWDPISDKRFEDVESIGDPKREVKFLSGRFVDIDRRIGVYYEDADEGYFAVKSMGKKLRNGVGFSGLVVKTGRFQPRNRGNLFCYTLYTPSIPKPTSPEALFKYFVANDIHEFPRWSARKIKKEWRWINRPQRVRIEQVPVKRASKK